MIESTSCVCLVTLSPAAVLATTPARYTVSPWITTWLMRGPVSKRWMVMLFSEFCVADYLARGRVMRHCDRRPRSLKLPEKRPDRLGAVDVMILRAQKRIHHAREARVRKTAGHAMAAIVDAIEHDIAPGR